MFCCIEPTNFSNILRIAYLSFIQLEKSNISYLSLFENKKNY